MIPETPMEAGWDVVPTLPGVVIPFQRLKLTRKPALPSGICESRCAGRPAEMATSTPTAPSAPKPCERRSWGLRENN
jgi:hypothetical protein